MDFKLQLFGQENMLNVPFLGITSTGFISDVPRISYFEYSRYCFSARPFTGDATRGIIVSPYRNS